MRSLTTLTVFLILAGCGRTDPAAPTPPTPPTPPKPVAVEKTEGPPPSTEKYTFSGPHVHKNLAIYESAANE